MNNFDELVEGFLNKEYFHGSVDKFPNGTVLLPEKGHMLQTKMDSHFKLEAFRSPNFLSRNDAVYLAQDVDDIDLAGGSIDHVYLVEPIGRVERHDVNWLSEIESIMTYAREEGTIEDEETFEGIENAALNYWNGVPHYNESIWEFLVPRAKIIREIENI